MEHFPYLPFCYENIYLYFIHMNFCLHVYMHVICMPGTRRTQKRISHQQLELKLVLSHHVGGRNLSWVFCKIIMLSQPLSHLCTIQYLSVFFLTVPPTRSRDHQPFYKLDVLLSWHFPCLSNFLGSLLLPVPERAASFHECNAKLTD